MSYGPEIGDLARRPPHKPVMLLPIFSERLL